MRGGVFEDETLDDGVGGLTRPRIKHLHAGRTGEIGAGFGVRASVEDNDHTDAGRILMALKESDQFLAGRRRVPAVEGGQFRVGKNDVVGVDQKEFAGHGFRGGRVCLTSCPCFPMLAGLPRLRHELFVP